MPREPFTPDGRGVVRITEAKGRQVEVKEYRCTVSQADLGVGMAWENLAENKTYHVNLDGKHSTCDCLWACYKAHVKPCRPIAAGLLLLDQGRLVVPTVETPEPLSEEPITDATSCQAMYGA
jgi:hypothetical protein